MTDAVVVVGSGASGVHFALTLLRKGLPVTMLDVGRTGAAAVRPDLSLNGLKDSLEDPSGYFLGPRYEGVLLPGTDGEYYGIPPSKDYVFDPIDGAEPSSVGFSPLFSFARGGLAEAWTGGCYPLNAVEVADFPFAHADLAPHYAEVARRIGVTGTDDDLARFMPLHDGLLPPLTLDRHSELLVRSYERARSRLNRAGVYIGRTRVATLSQALGGRQPCTYLGRCLWGCPHGALYTPSQTLEECRTHAGFTYVPGVEVESFTVGPGHRIRSVVARPIAGGPPQEFPVDRLALAAGALLSTKIFLTSMLRWTGERVRLSGLMDNRQILVPFVNLRLIGEPFSPDSYQYHLLGMGIESGAPADYVHGQITTLKTALLHPVIQRLPFDLAASTFIMRAMHAALGVVNVNFRDTRREDNYVELTDEPGGTRRLRIHYAPATDEPSRIDAAMRLVKKALHALGCVVPPGMAHRRPMGASVHYAGTLPMTRTPAPLTTTEHGQSRDFENLYLVDGATFPFLPAKNITFTLMANAVRIAEAAF
jgi:choline dehydrogenase-like flavoprotein